MLDATLAVAGRIAGNGPLGLRATKQLVRLAIRARDDYAAVQAEWQQTVFASDDAREGATAFIEKREPRVDGSLMWSDRACVSPRG